MMEFQQLLVTCRKKRANRNDGVQDLSGSHSYRIVQ